MKLLPIALVIVVLLDGCTATRPIRRTSTQTEFFSPIKARQRQQHSPHTPQRVVDVDFARIQDSLASVSRMVEYLHSRLSELEGQQEYLASKHNSLQKQLEYAQAENRRLSQEISELRARALVSKEPMQENKIAKPARHFSDLALAYEGALELFMQRQYDRSIDSFEYLLNAGIQEDLEDNCIYWIGENYFAQRKYSKAIQMFEKVLTIPNSNKHADAFFMLGRSYEFIGDAKKARWAYEQVVQRFPTHERAALARQKVHQLQPRGGVPQKSDKNPLPQSI